MTKKNYSKSSRNPRKSQSRSLEYQNLEQRLTLDASVFLAGSTLTLGNFTTNNQVVINADNDIVVTLAADEVFAGDITAPGVTLNADGNQVTVSGIDSLVVNTGGATDVVLNTGANEGLNSIDITTNSNINFNVAGSGFDSMLTRFTAGGNLVQTGGGPNSILLGDLGFTIGGDATFAGLTSDFLGGQIGGNFTANTSGLNLVDQFGTDFDGDAVPDALFVGGDAMVNIGPGSIVQAAPITVVGNFNLSNSSDGTNSIDLSVFSENDFSTIDLANQTAANPFELRIADRNSFTLNNARAQDIYLGAGRLGAGSLGITGFLSSTTLAVQASTGLNQTNGSAILTQRLIVGGADVSESSGDYIFNGLVEGLVLSPGDLVEIDVAFRVRGNLDLFTNSELNVLDTDLFFTDGRAGQQFDTSYVDGNTRLFANSIDFAVEFETSNFVLALQSDGTQTADSAIIADQFYLSGTRIDFASELNDVNQIAARASGDESFLRFFDVGTIRVISLDGTIEGASAARGTLPVLSGVSAERFPQIGIGEDSFVDLRTGFGGPVLNPRLGGPDIELDDIERFTIERDATILTFEDDEFGTDRDIYFIEFIHDGTSPFEIVASGLGFDAELALYDEVGNLLFAADDPVLNLNARITGDNFETPLPAGRYYIASAAFSATFADNFNVQTQFTPANQPTGTLRVSLTLGDPSEVVTADVVTIQGVLDTGFSQDVSNFGFVIDNDTDVTIFTGNNNRPGTDSAFDTEVLVFALNADGTLGALVGQDDDTSGGLDAFLNLSLNAGQYVAVVGEFLLEEFEARAGVANAGQGGPFEITFANVDGVAELPEGQLDPGLTLQLFNQPLIQPVPDTFLVPIDLLNDGGANRFDPALLNNPDFLVTGSPVTISGNLDLTTGSIGNFGFVLNQDDVVTVFIGDQTNGVQDLDFDTELFVFELNDNGTLGALVAQDDDSGDGLDSSLSVALTAGNYVAVLGQFSLSEADARAGVNSTVDPTTNGDFQITFEATDGVVFADPNLVPDRLETFIAPEVRRSVFQDDDAPIDTESLIISATEDGSILIDNPLNRIDRISVIETDDFTYNSTQGIILDQLNANGDVILTAVDSIIANDIDAQGDVTITAGADIIATNVAATGNFDFDAVDGVFINGLDAGGDVDVTAGAGVLLADLTTAGNIVALSGDDVVVDGIAATGNVTLEAGDDVRLTAANGIRRLAADNLILIANNANDDFDGIFLFTDVNSVAALVEGEGQIFINELSDIGVGSLSANDGPITLRAGGDIVGGAVSIVEAGNSISLVARGVNADINIASVSSPGSNDSIRLLADDDISASVEGGNLRVQALNNVADGNISVNLSTNVRSLSVDAGLGTNSVINRGDIIVAEANALVLSRAAAANGRITVNAGGNLIAVNVQADGVTDDDVIQLTASGAGADLVTSRVVARNNLGGVVLRANDDITDSNTNDNLQVVARQLTYLAGNSVQDNFNGIIGQSFAGTISARVTSLDEAGVFLFNSGNTVLTDSSVFNGRFSLINRVGTLTAENVSILSNRANSQIFLRTEGFGGDILIGEVNSGALGLTTVDSADDVFDTDTRDDFFARASFLSLTSRNNRSDSFDGIILNVDVDQFVDFTFNGGESFIRNRA